MNLSKEVTMIILECLIHDFNYYENINDENQCIRIEAEIKCHQMHLKTFHS